MRIIRVDLKEYYPDVLHESVYLDGVLYDDSFELNYTKRKSVLVLPGGGYSFISYREKDPIMFAFLAEGINAFALSYSCHRPYPTPHLEVACAMFYINTHVNEFHLLPNSVSLVGFSAGGHLACTYGYIYKKLADNNEELKYLRPESIILGYPVTSLLRSEVCECTTIISKNDKKLLKLLSVEGNITKNYPPTFVWTTKTDKCVEPENTKWLVNELKKKKIKNKCIIYNSGPHGMALANRATDANNKKLNDKTISGWVKLASEFIYSL